MASSDHHVRGRGPLGSRPRAVATAGVVGALLIGGALWANDRPDGERRVGNALVADQDARNAGQQVLGGEREPGVPSVQRLRHDDIQFTVTIAPARPGPNLVRVDATPLDAGKRHRDHAGGRFWVGTPEQDRNDELVPVRARPGTGSRWAVVDLPAGTGTVVVSHGPKHRVPFAVDTGTETPDSSTWTGPDGPECVTTATATAVAGGTPGGSCPADELTADDEQALLDVVDTLAGRGLEELAVLGDDSARSDAAEDVVAAAAQEAGLEVVPADAAPGTRNALLAVGGWETTARTLSAISARPLPEQPIRSDGTWMAPWLLSPEVVDSTSGVVVPLDFDIRDDDPQRFSGILGRYLPGQAPTASGYLAWRAQQGTDAEPRRLYTASRTAFLPEAPGHEAHNTEIAWFPGGTVTPIGGPLE